MRSDVDSLRGQPALVPRDGRVPALHPAARAPARPHSRRAVAAGSRAAADRAADQPRCRARRSREAWRALLLISGSVTEDRFWSETLDVGRPRADRDHRLAAPVARRAHDRDRRGLVRRSRRQRARRPLGVARRARARRGSRRAARACCASARTCGRRCSASSSAVGLGAALLVAASAGVALRWPLPARRRGAPHRADRRLHGLAHGPDDGHRAARHRAGRRRPGHGAHDVGPGARAAHRALAAAHLRPAQRDHLRPHDRRARRGHVHAARGGDRRPSSARRRATPATTGPRSRRGSTRRAASRSRRTATIYFADSHNDVIRRIDPGAQLITTVVGNHDLGTGFSGDNGPGDRRAARHAGRRRDRARRRPHRRRLAQRPHPPRRPADRRHHDHRRLGRERLRRRRQAGDRGGAQHAERRGRGAQRRHLHRRHAELPHPDDRGTRPASSTRSPATATPGDGQDDRRRRAGDERAPEHAERRRTSRRTATSTSPTCTTTASARWTRRRTSSRRSPATARSARPATTARRPQASLAGPAGIAVVPEPRRQGDDLHRRLLQRPRARRRPRRDHPQRERRGARGVRRAVARGVRRRASGWLYVADSSKDQVVALNIPQDRRRNCSCRRRGRWRARRGAAPEGGRPR